MKLSILIPVYNERKTLHEIISRVIEQKPQGISSKELIIVDDGSSDGSRQIIENFTQRYPEIILHSLPQNQGKGAAIQTAIEFATGDIAIIQDADLEYDPIHYSSLIAPILEGKADVVYGSRFLGAGTRRVLYYQHTLGNKFLTMISNLTTNLNLTDMETCYKAFVLSTIKTIPFRSKRFGIEPEFSAKIAKRKLKVYEVPVDYHGRTYAEGKKIRWYDGIEAIYTILKFWLIDDMFREEYGHRILMQMQEAPKFSSWTLDLVSQYLKGKVMEIGAGIGNNVTQILDYCDSVIATDYKKEYIDILHSMFSRIRTISVHQWDITQKPSDDIPQADTIFCSNVVEHIEDDHAAVSNMVRRLKKGGHLILVIPHDQSLYGTLDKELNHYRRYNESDFQSTFPQHGLKIVQILTFNKPGTLGWILNGKALKKKSLGRYNMKIYNSLVPLFQRIDPYLPWTGLSLIVIAEKIGTENSNHSQKLTS